MADSLTDGGLIIETEQTSIRGNKFRNSPEDTIRPLLAQLYSNRATSAQGKQSNLLKIISPLVKEYLVTSHSAEQKEYIQGILAESIRDEEVPEDQVITEPETERLMDAPVPNPSVVPENYFRSFSDLDYTIVCMYWQCLLDSRTFRLDRGSSFGLLSVDSFLRFKSSNQVQSFLAGVRSLFDSRLEVEYNARMDRLVYSLSHIEATTVANSRETASKVREWASTAFVMMKLMLMSDVEGFITELINLKVRLQALRERTAVYTEKLPSLPERSNVRENYSAKKDVPRSYIKEQESYG